LNLGFAIYQLVNNIKANTFVFLTIGTTLGAFVTLIAAAIFTYFQDIKKFFQKHKKNHLN